MIAAMVKRLINAVVKAARDLRRDGRELQVIGVVSDIRDRGPRETSLDTVYQDAGQLLASSPTVFTRCAGPCPARPIKSWAGG